MKLKLLAVAAAVISLTGTAHAALTSGSTTTNGSFSLVAFNTVSRDWYIRDLGYFINDFIPTGITALSGDGGAVGDKTPTTGLLIDKTVQANFGDAAFGTWFSAQNAADVRWMVGSYDQLSSSPSSQRRMIVSSTNPNETILNSGMDAFVQTGNFGGLSSLFNPVGNPLSATGASLSSVANNGFTSGIDLATVGQSAGLFYAVRSAFTGSSANLTTLTQYGNSTGFATMTLSANGDLVYNLAGEAPAPVPLPGAIWMMGAGLMAVGGVIRRRRAAANA